MAEYIEIKKMLASLVRCNKEEIDETCDILFSFGIDENNDKVILNKTLLDAYNDSKQYTYEHMEILSLEYRVPLKITPKPLFTNKLTFTIFNLVTKRGFLYGPAQLFRPERQT